MSNFSSESKSQFFAEEWVKKKKKMPNVYCKNALSFLENYQETIKESFVVYTKTKVKLINSYLKSVFTFLLKWTHHKYSRERTTDLEKWKPSP